MKLLLPVGNRRLSCTRLGADLLPVVSAENKSTGKCRFFLAFCITSIKRNVLVGRKRFDFSTFIDIGIILGGLVNDGKNYTA